jgi:hypothetical protein
MPDAGTVAGKGNGTGNGAGDGAGLPDPFDLTAHRVNPSAYNETGKVTRIQQILAGRPGQQSFFRVHPDPTYRMAFAMVDMKDGADREDYIVVRDLVPLLPGEYIYKMLYTTIDRQGVIRIWPVRIQGEDDRRSLWYQSAHEAAERATTKWVRIKANMSGGFYDISVSEAELPEPDWSQVAPFKDLLHRAYRDRVIDSLEHPVLKRLRGLV